MFSGPDSRFVAAVTAALAASIAWTPAAVSDAAAAPAVAPAGPWAVQAGIGFTPTVADGPPAELHWGLIVARDFGRRWALEAAAGRALALSTSMYTRVRAQFALAIGEQRRHRLVVALGPNLSFGPTYGTVLRADADLGYELRTSFGLVLSYRYAYLTPLNTSRRAPACATGCGERFEAGRPYFQLRVTVGFGF